MGTKGFLREQSYFSPFSQRSMAGTEEGRSGLRHSCGIRRVLNPMRIPNITRLGYTPSSPSSSSLFIGQMEMEWGNRLQASGRVPQLLLRGQDTGHAGAPDQKHTCSLSPCGHVYRFILFALQPLEEGGSEMTTGIFVLGHRTQGQTKRRQVNKRPENPVTQKNNQARM